MQGLAGNQCGLQGPYQVRHLCELIHIESPALATYRDDFYAGRPAVTVNAFGKGKAACGLRNDLAFQRDFFTALSKELALPRAIATELPPAWWRLRAPTVTTHLSSCRTTARKTIP